MSSFLTSSVFWTAAIERAVKSAAQGIVASAAPIALGAVPSLDEFQQKFVAISYAGLAMMLLSLLTSIGTAGSTDGNPSLGSSEVLAEPGAKAEPIGGEPVEVEPVDGSMDIGEPVARHGEPDDEPMTEAPRHAEIELS